MDEFEERIPKDEDKEKYKDIDIFVKDFIEMLKEYIDDYKEFSIENDKLMIFKCTLPDNHTFDTNCVACHKDVLNFKYNDVAMKRHSEDSFILYITNSLY